MALPTDCILIQASAVTNLNEQGAAVLAEVQAVVFAALGLSIPFQRVVWSPDLTRTYLYAHLPRRTGWVSGYPPKAVMMLAWVMTPR